MSNHFKPYLVFSGRAVMAVEGTENQWALMSPIDHDIYELACPGQPKNQRQFVVMAPTARKAFDHPKLPKLFSEHNDMVLFNLDATAVSPGTFRIRATYDEIATEKWLKDLAFRKGGLPRTDGKIYFELEADEMRWIKWQDGSFYLCDSSDQSKFASGIVNEIKLTGRQYRTVTEVMMLLNALGAKVRA